MKTESSPAITRSRARLLTLSQFHHQLHQEIAQAEARGWELTVVVFQVPTLARGTERQEVERALYHGVRRGHWLSCLRQLSPAGDRPRRRQRVVRSDFSARLSERLLAVALPRTGAAAGAAAERLGRLLSRVVDGPVNSGIAGYPVDGRTSTELITAAARRSQTASPLAPAVLVSQPRGGAPPPSSSGTRPGTVTAPHC